MSEENLMISICYNDLTDKQIETLIEKFDKVLKSYNAESTGNQSGAGSYEYFFVVPETEKKAIKNKLLQLVPKKWKKSVVIDVDIE